MDIQDLKNQDKPRERLIQLGVKSLSDVELLAILIGSGTRENSVFDIATKILKLYNLKELKELSYEKIIKVTGIKQAKACLILAAFELARRSSKHNIFRNTFRHAQDIYDYIYEDIMLEEKEIVIALYVDCKLKLIKKYVNTGSSAFQIFIPMKEIIANALESAAYGVILIHNHPSGDVEPSSADVEATFEVRDLLMRLDILLIDHLVVSKDCYYSMAEHDIIQVE